MGLGLAHLRRAGIPQYRRDARRHRGDRADRADAGEAGVRAARTIHCGALGDVDVMTADRAKLQHYLALRRGTISIIVVLTIYQIIARSGHFAPALMPPLGAVARTLWDSLLDGTMIEHAAFTLYRVLCGFGLAVFIGFALCALMGRFRPVENFVLPLASALMPI